MENLNVTKDQFDAWDTSMQIAYYHALAEREKRLAAQVILEIEKEKEKRLAVEVALKAAELNLRAANLQAERNRNDVEPDTNSEEGTDIERPSTESTSSITRTTPPVETLTSTCTNALIQEPQSASSFSGLQLFYTFLNSSQVFYISRESRSMAPSHLFTSVLNFATRGFLSPTQSPTGRNSVRQTHAAIELKEIH